MSKILMPQITWKNDLCFLILHRSWSLQYQLNQERSRIHSTSCVILTLVVTRSSLTGDIKDSDAADHMEE